MVDSSTSLSLLQRVRHRDQDGWRRLLYLYTPLVDHWCRGWGLQGADIDDLRQEVFQSVATGLAGYRRDRPGDTFRGWLWVIARRKYLDHCRRQERQPQAQGGSAAQWQLQQTPEPTEPPEDSPDLVRGLHHRALEMVRGEFEDRTWQAFWQCAVEGQSPADVGQAMGMTPTAVRQAKSRVLRRLKAEMADLLS